MNIEHSQLLRFTTAGNVDDGKSTLIGRLLLDSKSFFTDQLESISNESNRKGMHGIDLALFTDGLKDEVAQGITIDVAYRYFSTPKRKFIIADTPGHIQYTRNMVTGASTANAAVILIDARKGVTEQTKRHSFIASLLQISHIIVCVNKMDLVEWDEHIYNTIVTDFEKMSSKMLVKDVQYIPISALEGDNVVHRSEHMPWYYGGPLLHTLETMHISSDINKVDARFPVQLVNRIQHGEFKDFRGYAGKIASGVFRKDDDVIVLPSGMKSTIKGIHTFEKELDEAHAPMSVTITLNDEIDISRGDMITRVNNQPRTTKEFEVMLCWLNNEPAKPRAKYAIAHTSNEQRAIIKEVVYKIDINTFERNNEDESITMNDILRVKLQTTQPLMIDSYRENRSTGAIILIDEATNETVASGMII
jgi:sulfate adenylyltransferase subunit 1